MSDKGIAFLISVAIISAVFGGVFVFWGRNEAPDEVIEVAEEPKNIVNAKMACEESIRQQLHNPSSAEFPPLSDFKAAPSGERDGYSVVVSMRAKNLMNALSLNSYRCEIRELRVGERGGLTWKSEVHVVR